MTLHFAYGANMDPVHMAEQCPDARRLGTAVLPGHTFGIAAGGFGMVRADPGRVVRGVLWELSPRDEAALDAFEDVEHDFYRKSTIIVESSAGGPVEAMIYRPADDTPGRPAPGYLERIIEVCRALGFPPDYVAGLDAQRTTVTGRHS